MSEKRRDRLDRIGIGMAIAAIIIAVASTIINIKVLTSIYG